MKLYTYSPAPNPRRLDIFIAEKGISIETEQVDLTSGAHFSDWFREINPWSTVPTLVLDDGAVLTEVIGMYSYLENLYPDTPLLGTDPLSRAQILSWDHRCFVEGFTGVAEVLRNSSEAFVDRALPGPVPYKQIPELIERGRERIQAFYEVLDRHLAGRDYMVGDSFTVADIAALTAVDFSHWVKSSIPESCTNLDGWHKRISGRDSVTAHRR